MAEIIIISILILLNGLFSMSETAVVSSNKLRLENEAAGGNLQAKKALSILLHPGKFFSTVQIGITLIGIVSGAYGGATLAGKLNSVLIHVPHIGRYSESVSYILVILCITYLSIVVGELVPKSLGMLNPELIAKKTAYPMSVISTISAPVVWLLSKSTELILKVCGVKTSEQEKITDMDITSMIEKGTESGDFERVEHEVVESLFFLSDRTVGSLMRNRTDVVLLDINNEKKIRDQIALHPYYIFPVYEHNLDNIIGILNTKNVLVNVLQGQEWNFRDLVEPAIFVHDKMEALMLLKDFRNHRTDYVVVVDEVGQFAGIVTLRDVFDALVSNIDAQNAVHEEITQRADGSWLVDGIIPFDEFLRFFDLPGTEIHKINDFYTLAGFILYKLGHIPKVGEQLEWNGLKFEVVDMDEHRIDMVIVSKQSI